MRCTYCSKELPKGAGTMFVFRTGKINYYCSSRCYKNGIIQKRKFNIKELEAKRVR